MATDFDIHIGTRDIWGGGSTSFGLNDPDAFQHVWINGQTGVGKSALLLSMFAQTVANGHGCTLIDLNGDLANDALDYIPLSRRNDVVLVDPANAVDVLPINPFYQIPIDRRSVVAADFTEAAKNIWVESWGERMDWILYNIIAAVLDAPETMRPTILLIPLILTDKTYRNQVVKNIQDINVARFIQTEFNRWPESRRSEFIMPIENKIGKLIANPFVRNMLSPYRPAFQLKDAITNRSIVIVRLSKGALGSSAAKLLGSLTVSTILNAAMEQDALPYNDRIPHYLFIDEQHNLTTHALTSAYSEHRKYKLAIVSSTQYTDQLPDDMLASMFGNIGTIIAFRSSASDAHRFAHQIGEFPPDQYTQLGLGEVRVRLLRDGKIDVPFRARTTIDHLHPVNKAHQIRRFTRERYTTPRDEVEQTYRRWLGKHLIDPEERRQQRRQVAQKPKKQQPRPVLPANPPANISERGLIARAEIKAILKASGAPGAKKPTRRKQRHQPS